MSDFPLAAQIRYKAAPVTGKPHAAGNAWVRSIPAALIREMRSNPAVTYQLLDTDGNPLELPVKRFQRLQAACPKPFRVISRTSSEGMRHVWVACDPGYWEARDKKGSPGKVKAADPVKHPKKPCARCGIEFEHKRGNTCRDCRAVERAA